MSLNDLNVDELLEEAHNATKNAYCPYSKIAVGAALLASDGRIFHGVNVENASHGKTLCAEQVAVGTAIAAGVRKFRALVILAPLEQPRSPCNTCREMLVEFGNFPVIMCSSVTWKRIEATTSGLLPSAFMTQARPKTAIERPMK